MPLSPDVRSALRAYARRHGDRRLAAAARRCLRAQLGLGADRPGPSASAGADQRRRDTPLRLQLEPSLRGALGAPSTDGAALAALIAARLRFCGDLPPTPD